MFKHKALVASLLLGIMLVLAMYIVPQGIANALANHDGNKAPTEETPKSSYRLTAAAKRAAGAATLAAPSATSTPTSTPTPTDTPVPSATDTQPAASATQPESPIPPTSPAPNPVANTNVSPFFAVLVGGAGLLVGIVIGLILGAVTGIGRSRPGSQ